MKNCFKYFGIALLACGLMMASCDKEETPDNNNTNNGGENGGGNNGGNNGGGNVDTAYVTFKWDNEVKQLKSIDLQYYDMGENAVQLFLMASGDKTQSGDQTLVDLPSYHVELCEIGEQYTNAQPLDIMTDRVKIFSEEVMSDDDHMSAFTTPQSGNIVTLTTPDFAYVSHTKQNLSYDYEKHELTGTITITLKSVWDEMQSVTPRQSVLTITLNKYPAVPFSQGRKLVCRK